MQSSQLIQFYADEINKLRCHPQKFQPFLNDRIQRFNQNNQYSHYQFGNILFQTQQGKNGVLNCINYIKQIKKLKPLQLSQKMCQSAYQIGVQISLSNPKLIQLQSYLPIIQKYLKSQSITKNVHSIVEYGFRKDLDLLASIIIDDANPQRQRRNIIFGQKYKSIGISVHPHTEYDFFILILISEYQDEKNMCNCQIY